MLGASYHTCSHFITPPRTTPHRLTLPVQGLEPLTLTAPNGGGRFPFLGVQEVLMGRVSPDALLCPPDAVGDESRLLTPAQLANQVW